MSALVPKQVEEVTSLEEDFEPWRDEPEQWSDNHMGLRCLVIRNNLGAWSGYVRLPENHPWMRFRSGSTLDQVPATVHGGITFFGGITFSRRWDIWIGFHCSHYGDYPPRFPEHYSERHRWSTNVLDYKVIEYAKRQTMQLAVQAYEAHQRANEDALWRIGMPSR